MVYNPNPKPSYKGGGKKMFTSVGADVEYNTAYVR